LNVIDTWPLPVDSAFDTGGTSFDGRSSAVNVGLFAVLGVLGELLLQPAAIRASENMTWTPASCITLLRYSVLGSRCSLLVR
jgi:hypothetical protein